MDKRQQIHLAFKIEDPDHARAWGILSKNKGSKKYPTAADYVAAAINAFEEKKAPDKDTGIISDQDWMALGMFLADEIEKRIRPIIRGPVGK